MNSEKGLPAVLREWAGSYEEGSFDTEAGLMIEAADAIEDMLAALKAMMSERANGPDSLPIWRQAEAAVSRAEGKAS